MPKILLTVSVSAALVLAGWCVTAPAVYGQASDEPAPRAQQKPVGQPAGGARQPRRRPGDLRIPDKLKVGDPAPGFALKTLDGEQTVKLSDFRGKQPVVLIFGSYT